VVRSLFLSLLVLMSAPPSGAQVLSTYVREQVGTLPRGRFLVSLVNVSASLDSMYGRGGEAQSLSSNFGQSVSFRRIMEEDRVRGNQLGGLFLSNGVNLSDSAGTLSGTIAGAVSGKVPVLGYGLTEDTGIYLSIPVLNFRIRSRYSFSPSGATKDLVSQLQGSDQASVAAELNSALNTSLESKLFRAGYQWNPDLDRNYLGDMQITVLRVIPGSLGGWKRSLQPHLVLPTATAADLKDLYGLRAGDRRYGVGMKFAAEREFASRLQFNFAMSGTYLFNGTQGRRLPRDEADALGELSDPAARVGGGARILGQAQLRYPFPRWVGMNLGMTYQRRFAEKLSGNLHPVSSYSIASSRTASQLLAGYASIDLNSIQSFLDGGFLFPAQAELGVGLPIAGQNAVAEPVVEFQGTMFF
jgi:hypothetical protein